MKIKEREMPIQCGVCKRTAVGAIHRIKTGEYIPVCGWHDAFFGKENLQELGLSREEAVRIDKEVREATGPLQIEREKAIIEFCGRE